MLKEAEILIEGLKKFEACLLVVPSLAIRSIEKITEPTGPDFQAIVEKDATRQIIYLEIKTLGTPKNTREAVNLLLRWTQRQPEAYGIVIAPYISPASANICKDAGIGYVDLSGNCLIAFHSIFINREMMGNLFPFKSSLSSIYSPKSERILRVLLAFPYRAWRTIHLAQEAQVSSGMITHVSRKLIEEEWVSRTPNGISLTKPENLLDDWTNNYSIRRNVIKTFYSVSSLQEVETKVAETCLTLNIPYALTGFSACNRLAPMVRGQRAMIYINNDINLVAEMASLKTVESGANILLIQPYDQGVYWNARDITGIRICNPLQVYIDIKGYPGRGDEAADFLLKEVIQKEWQQQKANMNAS